MQITLKLKGWLKIALFFLVSLVSVSYVVYKVWKYYSYKAILSKTSAKRIRNFEAKPFEYTTEIKDTTDRGYLLLSPYVRFNLKYGKMVIMDLAGRLMMEQESEGSIVDFRQWKLNGRTRYTYGINDSTAVHLSISAGHFVITDSALNEIVQIHLLPHGDVTVNNHEDLDLHDLILFSEHHYIAMALYKRTVSNIPVSLYPAVNNKIAAPVIQEVNNGVVTWQWDGSKYPEFYEGSMVGNKFYDTSGVQDYMHVNSMIIDPKDSNLIMSLRQLNQVVKINRKTGDILWRLGGKNSDFPLTTTQIFMRQHNATLTDEGTLLLFDNGEPAARKYSRILEFNLDEQKHTVTSFKAFNLPGAFTESLGSVQKIGDDYLVSGGTANYVMRINSITGVKKMELKSNLSFYRAYLVQDIKGIQLNKK